jgi:hypothetical protein
MIITAQRRLAAEVARLRRRKWYAMNTPKMPKTAPDAPTATTYGAPNA